MIFAFGADGANSLNIFKAEKRLAGDIIDLQKDKDIKYSLIKYGESAQVVLTFQEVSSTSMLKQFINVMAWMRSGTAVDDVVRKAVKNFNENGRPEAHRALVLFVSGRAAPDPSQVERQRKLLTEAGVNTLVIALDSADQRKFDGWLLPSKAVIGGDPFGNTKVTVTEIINGITRGKMSSMYAK